MYDLGKMLSAFKTYCKAWIVDDQYVISPQGKISFNCLSMVVGRQKQKRDHHANATQGGVVLKRD